MSAGLPIIASYESGATTLVEDGKEGYIIKGRDPNHIAQAMIETASNLEENKRMGENAYLKGGKNNSWQDYSNRLLSEYRTRLNLK
jgi:glycosyltransferase involved in cell wall biosynthesis